MTPFLMLFNSYVKITIEQFNIVAIDDSVSICKFKNITLKSSIILKVFYISQLTNCFILVVVNSRKLG